MMMMVLKSDENALLPAAAATSRCRSSCSGLLLFLNAAHPYLVLLDVGRQLPVFPFGLSAELIEDLQGGVVFFCRERERGRGGEKEEEDERGRGRD